MNVRRVKFRISSYEDLEKAANQLYLQCGGSTAYETNGCSYEEIYLMSTIIDLAAGMQICVGNGGERIDL